MGTQVTLASHIRVVSIPTPSPHLELCVRHAPVHHPQEVCDLVILQHPRAAAVERVPHPRRVRGALVQVGRQRVECTR
eukprot:311566-Chlamydomonas_euryale.AAC.2